MAFVWWKSAVTQLKPSWKSIFRALHKRTTLDTMAAMCMANVCITHKTHSPKKNCSIHWAFTKHKHTRTYWNADDSIFGSFNGMFSFSICFVLGFFFTHSSHSIWLRMSVLNIGKIERGRFSFGLSRMLLPLTFSVLKTHTHAHTLTVIIRKMTQVTCASIEKPCHCKHNTHTHTHPTGGKSQKNGTHIFQSSPP